MAVTTGEVIGLIKAFGGSSGGGGGSSSAPLIINVTITDIDGMSGTGTMDKTAGEIFAAMQTTGAIWKATAMFNGGDEDFEESLAVPLIAAYRYNGTQFMFSDWLNGEWMAATADDYPTSPING